MRQENLRKTSLLLASPHPEPCTRSAHQHFGILASTSFRSSTVFPNLRPLQDFFQIFMVYLPNLCEQRPFSQRQEHKVSYSYKLVFSNIAYDKTRFASPWNLFSAFRCLVFLVSVQRHAADVTGVLNSGTAA